MSNLAKMWCDDDRMLRQANEKVAQRLSAEDRSSHNMGGPRKERATDLLRICEHSLDLMKIKAGLENKIDITEISNLKNLALMDAKVRRSSRNHGSHGHHFRNQRSDDNTSSEAVSTEHVNIAKVTIFFR